MSEIKHTPGPYFINKGMFIEDSSGNRLAQVYDNRHFPEGEFEANVELFRAAPDLLAERDQLAADKAELLEVLKDLISFCEKVAREFDGPFDGDDEFYVDHREKTRAIIAKHTPTQE